MLGERKFGGVLCEARWQGAMPAWVTVGVGLNVANAPPEELAAVATYLASSRPGLTPEALVVPVINAVRAIDPVGGSLTPSELAELARLDWLGGRALAAPEAGIADGIAADGALRVRRSDGGVTMLRAGTVVLAETPATADLRSCS